MRPLPAFRLLTCAALATLSVSACGGDDLFPRDEFVEQTMASGITQPVAECAYDRIKTNTAIMKELNRTGGPNPDISEKVSAELSTILARCLLAAEDAESATTTTDKTSTTTEKE